MKKYERIPIEVEAQQYFPYILIDVDGFSNIEETVLDSKTLEDKTIVHRGEIRQGDTVMSLDAGEWVLVLPDGTVTKKTHVDFTSSFQLIT
jgi:hypothetical protein